MAITRRQFIKRTGAVAAGTLLGPGLFSNPLIRRALADTIGDRFFVVIYLNGGNDGLNTVTPVSDGYLRTAYDDARNFRTGPNAKNGGINLTPDELAFTIVGNDPNTTAQIALHPGLIGLKNLGNKVAVIQGCGYPDYNLSHEQSRSIWQSADPLGSGIGTGWIGRHLAANYGGLDIPAVNISDAIVGEFKQNTTSVLTLSRLVDFGFPYEDVGDNDENLAKRAAFLNMCNEAHLNAQPTMQYIGDSGSATLLSSEKYPLADAEYQIHRGDIWNPQYDAVGGLADDLREVAKIIYGVSAGVPNVNAHFFQVSTGGFDTHSDQGGAQTNGQHYSLLRELGDSIEVFYNDLADMGLGNKVCILVWSEFARRIPQNDNGTDHGSQGPMFVVGGAVTGGVYGNHPDIANLDGNENTIYKQGTDDFRSTDFRDVYGTILKHWLGMDAGDVGTLLPADGGDPDFYWTVRDFDLGFL